MANNTFQSFTTGPIYIEPELRRSGAHFGLMISLFFGVPNVTIQSIELFAAKNTGFNTPEDWVRIFFVGTTTLTDEDMINYVDKIHEDYPYFQWVITYVCTQQVAGVTHALYLLDKYKLPIEHVPLIPNGDWTPIPNYFFPID